MENKSPNIPSPFQARGKIKIAINPQDSRGSTALSHPSLRLRQVTGTWDGVRQEA